MRRSPSSIRPGLHPAAARALNRAMNRTAAAALAEADLCVRGRGAQMDREDEMALERIASPGLPAHRGRQQGRSGASRASGCCRTWRSSRKRYEFREIVPVSALKGRADRTSCATPSRAAAGRGGDVSARHADRPRPAVSHRRDHPRKLTLELGQEVPYGIAVEIEQNRGGRRASWSSTRRSGSIARDRSRS